ncbi:hypothetical protein ACFVWN_27305 [Nocardiopsis flavescens]|uniref:hypothetical protein n=1 Tax=Nocardiopsis flavescens TaxID=758803 RepID=UPI003664D459
MSYEERGTWVYLVVSAGVYAAYVAVVLSRAASPITATDYRMPLLWSVGAAIVAAVVLRIVVDTGAGIARGVGDAVARESRPGTGSGAGHPDADPFLSDDRDREIDRIGTLRTWGVLAAAALAALLMALAEWPHFWIANVLYLGFVLQAVSSATVKLVAYRRGL